MADRALRVCFVLSTRGYAFGGLVTVADRLAAGLAARGHRVSFIAGAAVGRPRRRDIPRALDAVYVPVLPHTSLAVRALARLLRTEPLNTQSLGFFLGALSRPGARRRLAGADVAVTFLEGEAVLFSRYLARRGRGSVHYYPGGIDARWARRDRSTLRVATSQTLADHARRIGAGRIDGVVTPGIAAELLAGPPAAARSSGSARLLSIGRLEANKRIGFLLPLVEALVPDFGDLTLRIVGDGPERASLDADIDRRGLRRTVTLCGALPADAVYAELSRADLFLFPSRYESFGIAPLEALAAGVPVIASALPALREATGGHASLLPPDDLAAWRDAARRLLTDAELRQAAARAGREWAADFTWDRIVARFEPYVRRAAARQG